MFGRSLTRRQKTLDQTGVVHRLTLFLFTEAFCLGLIIPSLPSLLEGVSSSDFELDSGSLPIITVGALVFASYAAAQFLSAPLIGWWSDQLNRKKLVQISLGAASLSYLALALAENSATMLLARAMAGFAGSVWLPANSFIGSIVKQKDRPSAFAKLGASSALGFILGPVVGGFFAQFGASVPCLLAASFSGLAFLASGVFLDHLFTPGISPKDDGHSVISRATDLLRRHFSQMTALFFIQLVFRSQPFLWPFYLAFVLDWKSNSIGFVLGIYAFSMLLTQILATSRLLSIFGAQRVCVGGLIVGALLYAVMVFVPSFLVYPMVALMGFAAALIIPAFQAFTTQMVSPDRQGQFQGLVTSAIAMASVVGPLLMAAVLPSGFSHVSEPSAPFIVAALLLFCAILLITLSASARSRGSDGT